MDPAGNLMIQLGRHKFGKPNQADILHLGSRGLPIFSRNIKGCIVRSRKPQPDSLPGNLHPNPYKVPPQTPPAHTREFGYSYRFPNPAYARPSYPYPSLPHPQATGFNGDYSKLFNNGQRFQLTNINQISDGYSQ